MYLPTAEKSGALLLPFWHFLPKCWEQNQCSLWAVTQHTVTLCQVLNKPWLIQGLHSDNSIYFVWSFRYTDVYSLIPNFKFALKIQNERRTQPNAAAYPFYATFCATEYMRATCMTWTLSFGHFCFCFQCPIFTAEKPILDHLEQCILSLYLCFMCLLRCNSIHLLCEYKDCIYES